MRRVFREKIPQEAASVEAEWTEQHVAAQLLPRNLGNVFDFLGTDLKVILVDCSLQVFCDWWRWWNVEKTSTKVENQLNF